MGVKEISGELRADRLRIGIVVSRFNEMITEPLLQGALDTWKRCGGSQDAVTVVRVPGSFELPFAARKLAGTGKVDAVVCLGALIQGETDHYKYLASAVTNALARLPLELDLPVAYGLITASTVEQALNRAGVKHGNKGVEATLSAIEMAHVGKLLSRPADA